MKFVFGVAFSISQILSIIALYWLMGLLLALVSPHFIPGYTVESADNDTRTILIVFLLWDRFYGPYSVFLKSVARVLYKSKKRSAN